MKYTENKDIKCIKLFNPLYIIVNHGWIEDENGIEPELAYIQYTSNGIKNGKTKDIQKLNELLARKSNRDLLKKEWTEGLKIGILSVDELLEDNKELYDMVFDCMKDIVKTTDRLEEIRKNSYTGQIIAYNRNWFLDKLNMKMPEEITNCSTCKESYYKNGTYVKH